MAVPYNIETDRAVVKPTGLQKLWQTLWNMKPLLGVCLGVCLLVTIAIVIVLALIPLYIQTKNVTVYQPNAVPFLVTFTTNQGGKITLTDFNLNQLNIQLRQQLKLQRTTVKYAVLSPTSLGKKRQVSNNIPSQCQVNVGTTGNLFIISFTIDYSNGCNYPNCEQKFIEAVEYQVATVSNNLTLTLTLTNGTTIQIVVNFCSINQTDSSIPTTITTTTTTTTAVPTCSTCILGNNVPCNAACSEQMGSYQCSGITTSVAACTNNNRRRGIAFPSHIPLGTCMGNTGYYCCCKYVANLNTNK